MRLIPKPKLFLSYARSDARLAESLYQLLESRGFMVFKDSAEILAGENFVERIVGTLRQADAVVALETPASAESDWCQAELYHAHALGVQVIPVRIGIETRLTRPLELLQRRIHQLQVDDPETAFESLPEDLEEHLTTARQRRRRRQVSTVGLILLVAALVLSLGTLGIGSLDRLQQRRERLDILDQLETSQKGIAGERLESLSERFATDSELLKSLLLMSEDDSRSDAARFNAWMLSAAMLADRKTEDRWVIEDIDLKDVNVREANLTEVTISNGSIRNVTFEQSAFGGVVWGEGPAEARGGLVLGNLRFVDSDFYFTWFAGTTGVGIEFVNTSFRGSEIDLTRLSLVRFVSRSAQPDLKTLITDEVTVIENSVILNHNTPPDPGVLDLSVPTEEALFEGVVFVATHFRGYIRPEWFRNCSFRHCVFPTALSQEALLAGENMIDSCLWNDESLY